MPDIDSTRTKSHEALDLGIAIVGPKIDVESVLDGLGFGYETEQKAGCSLDVGPNLELIWVVVHDDPAERSTPPTSEVDRRDRIDDQLLPGEAHKITLPTVFSQAALAEKPTATKGPVRGMFFSVLSP